MSRSTVRALLTINDGSGNSSFLGSSATGSTQYPLALQGIQTGVWVSRAVNIDEHRRVNITLGVGSSTGAAADVGGFTGTLYVLGTDELAQCYGGSGTSEAGGGSRPGVNGYTGARFWNPIPSGTIGITGSMTSMALSFTDVGAAFIRLAFNVGPTGLALATGTLGGSGTMYAYLTAKNA